MKKLVIILAILLGFFTVKAQKLFVEYGYTSKITTLSQKQYNKFFENDTIVQIESQVYNAPDKRCPWCLVIWGAAELGMAIYDAYDAGETIIDPNASSIDKVISGGGFLLGIILPGGGYGTIGKKVTKEVVEATTKKVLKETTQQAMRRGRLNEAKTIVKEGLTKNNKTFKTIDPKTGKPINVKPDAIDANKVSEIKDTKTVSNTKQIRGERQVAKEQNKKFEIVTGKNTKVSKSIPKNEVKKLPYLGPKSK